MGPAGPSPSLGVGVGEGLLHPASEEMGGKRGTSGKAKGNEWLQGYGSGDKTDSMCLSWKLARGQIKFRSNQGRYAGKRVSLMSPSLFNCLVTYWAKESGGDSKSHHDEDSDALSPAETRRVLGPVVLVTLMAQEGLGSEKVFFAISLSEQGGSGMGKVNLGGASSSHPDTPSLQPVPGALQPPAFTPCPSSRIQTSVLQQSEPARPSGTGRSAAGPAWLSLAGSFLQPSGGETSFTEPHNQIITNYRRSAEGKVKKAGFGGAGVKHRAF